MTTRPPKSTPLQRPMCLQLRPTSRRHQSRNSTDLVCRSITAYHHRHHQTITAHQSPFIFLLRTMPYLFPIRWRRSMRHPHQLHPKLLPILHRQPTALREWSSQLKITLPQIPTKLLGRFMRHRRCTRRQTPTSPSPATAPTTELSTIP